MTTHLIADRAARLKRLRALRPEKIAVAYVGLGWRNLLGDTLRLKEIVLSPTQGSNPRAIEQIAKEIGWTNVHFLDELHSKLYLGDGQVIFGSANLSDNAFGSGQTELYEMVVHSSDSGIVTMASIEFERYRALAMDSYRSEKDKKKRLKEMKAAQPALEEAGVKLDRPQAPTLDMFEIGSRRIHLEWYEAEGEESNDFEGEADDRDFTNVRLNRVGQMKIGDWLLEWPCTDDGRLVGKFDLSWMRIDAVRAGVHDMEYPDQVAARNTAPRTSQPFQINEVVRRAFRQVIVDWPELHPKGDGIGLASPPIARVNMFLRQLKERYNELI